MSILRMTIATSDNQTAQEEASKQLRSDAEDYRLAKSNVNDQIAGLIAGAVINSQPWDQATIMTKLLTSFNVLNDYRSMCLFRMNSLNQFVFF